MDMELSEREQLDAEQAAKAPEGAPSGAEAGSGAVPDLGSPAGLPTHTESSLKRTGRPVHPLWAHFHRGEKRNRYHYHAFCSYCVARHGLAQVSPTRGVSPDMLRHLESCSNCPRKIVEEIKELCNQRERQALAKKKAGHQHSQSAETGSRHAASQIGDTTVASSEREQQQMLGVVSAKRSAHEASLAVGGGIGDATTSVDDSNVYIVDAGHLNSSVSDRSHGSKTQRGFSSSGQPSRASMNASVEYLTTPAKRTRTGSRGGGDVEQPVGWKVRLLQATVAAGLPLSVFQKTEFQKLVRLITPEAQQSGDNGAAISAIGSHAFLSDTAVGLARGQLDRVKEGMLNSTIKGGLTLSVTCWRTLDLQQLVAFALVNSNGDAACVRVVDLGGQQRHAAAALGDEDSSTALLLPLAGAIEDVLLELQKQNICVMGVVADSAVVLSAARRVCRTPRWHSLLVVPCLSALLASLAGTILAHEAFREAVGQLVEVAAYFSNAQLLASLHAASGDPSARIPLPTRDNWFSFLACLATTLRFSDAITAVCSGELDQSGSSGDNSAVSPPSALQELVLGGDGQLWKTLHDLNALLAPLREAHSLVFQPKPKLGEEEDVAGSEFATTVHGGLTLAHVMYQLGRMSQQYTALAHDTDVNSSADVTAAANRLHGLLDAMWQRYDLPVMVLAFVFDFHLDTARLDMSSSALQWKAIASYFQIYFQRWFGQPPNVGSENAQANAASSALLTPIPRAKMEEILNAYQMRQFPFDEDTTSDYADVSSFYSFVSDSHPEICALCCRVYAVALATADVKRVVRGIGFVPTIAQTTERPEQVELLLHVGFASSLKRLEPPASSHPLSDITQTNHPEELICGQEEWQSFAADWRALLDRELEADELEQMQQLHEIVKPNAESTGEAEAEASHVNKDDGAADELHLPLDQLFFDALPPLPAARVVAPSPHDPSVRVAQAIVDL